MRREEVILPMINLSTTTLVAMSSSSPSPSDRSGAGPPGGPVPRTARRSAGSPNGESSLERGFLADGRVGFNIDLRGVSSVVVRDIEICDCLRGKILQLREASGRTSCSRDRKTSPLSGRTRPRRPRSGARAPHDPHVSLHLPVRRPPCAGSPGGTRSRCPSKRGMPGRGPPLEDDRIGNGFPRREVAGTRAGSGRGCRGIVGGWSPGTDTRPALRALPGAARSGEVDASVPDG